ncbi:hypothetical protein [Acidithiobacillus ferridurans]|uniref:Uncharacterized protein n=1 Tax=Acidithiobacillus ferridurans TaxID=1232575 RepID=A0A8X8G9L2_ACIFI|nr:hypothetical protein [Acidithiobacillus ferridurans]MBU2715602.1 hypothetical protein [Acidithiobacillus ferridurans]MBU2722908.1 hypothetical protein [Acidithiobacillus ferridurans]MBU2728200.1 hypothetical protein [Acidithiobacillus ferridurans]
MKVSFKALKLWTPNCEQAKHIAGALRIVGLGFFAAFGYGPTVDLLKDQIGKGFCVEVIMSGISAIIWIAAEVAGVLAIGKGGCP